jgi:hypothetical protein
VNGELDEI